jgi:hypothetical protein
VKVSLRVSKTATFVRHNNRNTRAAGTYDEGEKAGDDDATDHLVADGGSARLYRGAISPGLLGRHLGSPMRRVSKGSSSLGRSAYCWWALSGAKIDWARWFDARPRSFGRSSIALCGASFGSEWPLARPLPCSAYASTHIYRRWRAEYPFVSRVGRAASDFGTCAVDCFR